MAEDEEEKRHGRASFYDGGDVDDIDDEEEELDEEEDDEEARAIPGAARRKQRDARVPRHLTDTGAYQGLPRWLPIAGLAVAGFLVMIVVFAPAIASVSHGSSKVVGVDVRSPDGAPATAPTSSADPLAGIPPNGGAPGGGRPRAGQTSAPAGTGTGTGANGSDGSAGGGGGTAGSGSGGAGRSGSEQTTPDVRTPAEIAAEELAERRATERAAGTQVAVDQAATQVVQSDPDTAAQIAQALGAGRRTRVADNVGESGGDDATPAASPSPHPTPTPRIVNLSTVHVDENESFVDGQRQKQTGYTADASVCEVSAGTPIDATLYEDLSTQLPGTFTLFVNAPVFDSRTHSIECIPTGAWLDGEYDARVVNGQDAVLCAVTRIRFPGKGIKFLMDPQVLAGERGSVGVQGSVNDHRGRIFGAAALLGVITAAVSVVSPAGASALQAPNAAQAVSAGVGSQVANAGTQILTRDANIPPTITVKAGTPVKVLVRRDIPLDPYTP